MDSIFTDNEGRNASEVTMKNTSEVSMKNIHDINEEEIGHALHTASSRDGFSRPPRRRRLERSFEILLLVGSVLFLAFAISACSVKGDITPLYHGSTSTRLDAYKQLAKLVGGTFYQPFFAMVAGNLTSHLARWRMERGERLRVLEQLQASSSLPRTITMAWKLKWFSKVALLLMLFWSFYFVGGQASLRLFDATIPEKSSISNITYMSDTASTFFSPDFNSDEVDNYLFNIRSLFTWSVSAPRATRKSGRDLAGNAKIPFVKYLNDSTKNKDGWIVVPQDDPPLYNTEQLSTLSFRDFVAGLIVSGAKSKENLHPPMFSSLIGIRVFNLSQTPQTSNEFEVTTAYLDLNCSDQGRLSATDIQNFQYQFEEQNPVENPDFCSGTGEANDIVMLGPSTETTANWTLGLTTSAPPPTRDENKNSILAGKRLQVLFRDPGVYIECNMTQQLVDVKVRCFNSICGVEKARLASKKSYSNLSADYAHLDQCAVLQSYLKAFIDFVALPQRLPGKISFLEAYLKDSEEPLNSTTNDIPTKSISDILRSKTHRRDLEIRLSQLLNTAWRASLAPFMWWGTIQTSELDYSDQQELQNVHYKPMQIESKVAEYPLGIDLNMPWFITLLFCAVVLLVASLGGIWLGSQIQGPDIIGYVSTMTRDNPHFKLPEDSGNVMSGPERALQLQNIRVKFMDVDAKNNIGHSHLLLTPVGEDGMVKEAS